MFSFLKALFIIVKVMVAAVCAANTVIKAHEEEIAQLAI